MILQFKSKEDVKMEKANEVLEVLTGIAKERWNNICLGNINGSDRLLISNLFINTKFQLRKIYQRLHEYNTKIKAAKIAIMVGLTKESLYEYEEYVQALEEAIDVNKSQLTFYGAYLIDSLIPLLNGLFTEHEIIQLVGGSVKAAEEIKSTMDELELKSKQGFAFNLIYHHGEYRWRKGRSKDFIDCPKWEMPLFHCISKYILHKIKSDPSLKQASDEVFEKMFGDAMVYATYDNEGKIIGTEKVKQDVKAKDLLLNFKDLHTGGIVSKLKKESLIDIDTEYKLKKLGDCFYRVDDKEGNPLGKVMKKRKK